jgi:hypothetical protein
MLFFTCLPSFPPILDRFNCLPGGPAPCGRMFYFVSFPGSPALSGEMLHLFPPVGLEAPSIGIDVLSSHVSLPAQLYYWLATELCLGTYYRFFVYFHELVWRPTSVWVDVYFYQVAWWLPVRLEAQLYLGRNSSFPSFCLEAQLDPDRCSSFYQFA